MVRRSERRSIPLVQSRLSTLSSLLDCPPCCRRIVPMFYHTTELPVLTTMTVTGWLAAVLLLLLQQHTVQQTAQRE